MFFRNLKCLLLPLSGRAETNPRYQLEVDCISERDYFFLKITISQRQEERAIKSCDELFGNRESLCYFFPPLSLILQRYGGLLCIKEGKDDCEKSKHEHVYSAAFFHICSYKFRILTNKVGKKITDSNKEKGACGLFQV